MTKPSKPATRADLLADISASYVLKPPQPGEITVSMLIALEPHLNANQAAKVMKKAVLKDTLSEPVYRTENGRRVLAWARKV